MLLDLFGRHFGAAVVARLLQELLRVYGYVVRQRERVWGWVVELRLCGFGLG
jgi:hypothetical protein